MEKIKLELNPLENGVMLIWEGIEECAKYKVKLYARKNEPIVAESCFFDCYGDLKPEKINLIKMNIIIDEIEVERTKKYLAIKDLAQLNVELIYWLDGRERKKLYDKGYFVEVIAEDRLGNEITKSDLINFGPGKKENNYIVYGGKGQVCC